MFERFTDRARKVMAPANQEAQRFNHDYIGNEHILLALVKEGTGVGAHALRRVGIDLGKLRHETESLLEIKSGSESLAKVPQTVAAKATVMYAIEEARGLNHNYVGTEHMLLGLLRGQAGIAEDVLTKFGVRLDDTRKTVVELLNAQNDPAKQSFQQRPSGAALPFGVVNATLCSGVTGFGQYDPLPSREFPAGELIVATLYVEVEGAAQFRSAEGLFVSILSFESSLRSQGESGESWNLSGRRVSTAARRVRRDIFLTEEIGLPKNLMAGWYSLQVVVVDMVADCQAGAAIPIQIRPVQ